MRASRRSTWLLLCIGLALTLSACGQKGPDSAEFSGSWRHVTENSMSGDKIQEVLKVVAKGKKFRQEIETVGESSKTILVYDGKTLYTQSPYDQEPQTTAEQAGEDETYRQRFWASAVTQGAGEPGGTIAGREAVHFHTQDRRTDGEMDQETWLDRKTGLLLKSILIVNSNQVEKMVMRETWECQQMTFGPVDESAFIKP
jgi:outer membrane lipoprotein-sorting protein